jgi:hypothetical protein
VVLAVPGVLTPGSPTFYYEAALLLRQLSRFGSR